MAQIRSWIAVSRSAAVEGAAAGQVALTRSIACAKAVRSCSSTSRCDALGSMACSIRSINASASAVADVLPQRPAADASGAVAGDAASLTWLVGGPLCLTLRSSASEADNAVYTMVSLLWG